MKATPPNPSTFPSRRTVDLYERDEATRELMQKWLREAGYYVRKLNGSRDPPGNSVDLVILATQVSALQTLEVVRTMRVIYPTTAFLVLSSHSSRSRSCPANGVGAADTSPVLSKPLTREQLLEAVRALI
jgi:DNA-binding response OmpR family regulator